MSGSTNSETLTLGTQILFQWLQKPQAITFQNALLPAKLLRKVCLFCAKYLICMFHGHKERELHPLAGYNRLLLLWLKTHRASRWGTGSEAISYDHLTHACILHPLTQTVSQYDSIVPIIFALLPSPIVLLTMKIETMIHKIEAKHLQEEMCGLIKRHACTIIRRQWHSRIIAW